MKYCGGTFSGFKLTLCAKEITVLWHRCTPEGWLPDKTKVKVIVNWGPCKDLSDVHSFLGTIGVCQLFIKNFAHRVHHLVKLTHKGTEWEFGQEQLAAMKDLKEVLFSSPALRPIDYHSNLPVILYMDTSYIAVSYILSQCDPDNPKFRYHSQLCSMREKCDSPNQNLNSTGYTELSDC